ncbi:hypothetical protein T484DRAFT_1778884 [Baffinella frigidus]|nr:hypothetical protein T484DRAFT_1778884 [Cryptophyta sp. CCMP2293]
MAQSVRDKREKHLEGQWEKHTLRVEGFRYRAEDSLKRVSKLSVKRARIREIEGELMNSASLEDHFSANPQDLKALKHDRALAPTRVQNKTDF